MMFKMSEEREQRALRAAFIFVIVVPICIELICYLFTVMWSVVSYRKPIGEDNESKRD